MDRPDPCEAFVSGAGDGRERRAETDAHELHPPGRHLLAPDQVVGQEGESRRCVEERAPSRRELSDEAGTFRPALLTVGVGDRGDDESLDLLDEVDRVTTGSVSPENDDRGQVSRAERVADLRLDVEPGRCLQAEALGAIAGASHLALEHGLCERTVASIEVPLGIATAQTIGQKAKRHRTERERDQDRGRDLPCGPGLVRHFAAPPSMERIYRTAAHLQRVARRRRSRRRRSRRWRSLRWTLSGRGLSAWRDPRYHIAISSPAPTPTRRTTLTRDELDQLARFATLREVRRGERVFRRFDDGDRMYLVETGAIELVFENGRPRKRIGPTGFFGELALLFGSHRRSATAVAAEDSRLWELDLETFDVLSDRKPRLLFSVLRRSCASLLESERALARYLQRRNRELASTLERLQTTEELLTDAEIAAHTDPLTKLYNRRFLELRIGSYLERATEGEIGLVLVLVDLDDFKRINDRYGHAIGDEVLVDLAGRLNENTRDVDLACRIGGDEFAIFMVHGPDLDPSRRVAKLFRRVSPLSVPTPDGPVQITVSLGGAPAADGDDWPTFFDRADENLYRAKAAGRNRLAWDGRTFEA